MNEIQTKEAAEIIWKLIGLTHGRLDANLVLKIMENCGTPKQDCENIWAEMNQKPEVQLMSFNQAVTLLSSGYLMARKGWLVPGRFVFLINYGEFSKSHFGTFLPTIASEKIFEGRQKIKSIACYWRYSPATGLCPEMLRKEDEQANDWHVFEG